MFYFVITGALRKRVAYVIHGSKVQDPLISKFLRIRNMIKEKPWIYYLDLVKGMKYRHLMFGHIRHLHWSMWLALTLWI